MNKPLVTLCLSLCLAACANQPIDSPEPSEPSVASPDKQPSRNFAPDSLYQLLVAEILGNRLQPEQALVYYNRQAQQTGSAKVAERAWQIANFLDQRQAALDNAQLWADQAPEHANAQLALALELARAQRFSESLQRMEQALELDPDNVHQLDFISQAGRQADEAERDFLRQQLEQLQQRHPQQLALPLARATLLQDQHPQQALQLLQQLPRSSQSLDSLLLQAQLHQQLEQPKQAISSLQQALQLQPEHLHARMALARQLAAADQLELARAEFLQLLQDHLDNDEFRLALAFINMDLEAWDEAALYLEELIQRDSFTDTAQFHLGRSLEAREQTAAALASYHRVEPSHPYLAARQRIGELLLEQGKPEDFKHAFAQARQQSPHQADSLWLIECELLARNHQPELAWQRINQALEKLPNHPDLLYSRAMQAEKRDDLKQLEQDLRQILHQDPEHAIAMNALGYTLADRTERYQEALQLIQNAHQLQPEDVATQDSLGWVYFKLGQYELAHKWLHRAYQAYPDAEIGAHLGEVLWQQGQQRQARKVWKAAFKLDAQHPVLLDTLQRLTGREQP